ncbi:MAG: hypothetical protein ABIP39_04940, partial [Polyangiaceae bacterium]
PSSDRTSMVTPRPPPRLFVIMAKRAPIAIVVRKGPAAWTQLILWETKRDAFTEGAWFRGRIYADKCDLSPDGELFVYAAFQGQRLQTSFTQSWTAVSRPPWLHALVLWPMGTTYGGGGRFVDDRRLILRGVTKTHPKFPLRGLEIAPGPAERQASTDKVEGADWSGRDQREHLVFAARGRIFRRTSGKDVELSDFTTQRPDPQPPPEWATRPLKSGRSAP